MSPCYMAESEIPATNLISIHILFLFLVSYGHSRTEYKAPDISAEEKNVKFHSVTSTQGPGEGMQLTASSTPGKPYPCILICLLSIHAKLPCVGKSMPQSGGPTFGKQVLLCL